MCAHFVECERKFRVWQACYLNEVAALYRLNGRRQMTWPVLWASSKHPDSALMQKKRQTHISSRGFHADDLRMDRLYVSSLGELKEIIVRGGFLPRQPWQVKERTIGACRVNEEQTISMLFSLGGWKPGQRRCDLLQNFQKTASAACCVTTNSSVLDDACAKGFTRETGTTKNIDFRTWNGEQTKVEGARENKKILSWRNYDYYYKIRVNWLNWKFREK